MEEGSVVLHTCLLWWQTSKVRSSMCSLVSQPCLACLFHGYTLTQRFTHSSDIWANLQILGARNMTWYNFHTEHLQLWDCLWNSLLSSAFCSVNEKQFTSVWKQKIAVIMLKILGTNTLAARHPWYVHPSNLRKVIINNMFLQLLQH